MRAVHVEDASNKFWSEAKCEHHSPLGLPVPAWRPAAAAALEACPARLLAAAAHPVATPSPPLLAGTTMQHVSAMAKALRRKNRRAKVLYDTS